MNDYEHPFDDDSDFAQPPDHAESFDAAADELGLSDPGLDAADDAPLGGEEPLDDELAEWLEQDEPADTGVDPGDAEPGSIGALSDLEFDAWLSSSLEPPPDPVAEEELIDRIVQRRIADD